MVQAYVNCHAMLTELLESMLPVGASISQFCTLNAWEALSYCVNVGFEAPSVLIGLA